MTKAERQDPRKTSGAVIEGLSVSAPLAQKKAPATVPVAARITRELWLEIEAAAKENNVKPGRLVAYGLAYFMRRLKADPSILKFETKRELPRG